MANVARLADYVIAKRPSKKPQPAVDDLFFIKEQISVGIVLEHFGRLDSGSLWDVNRITTEEPTSTGVTKTKSVTTVHRLHDIVHMTRRGSSRERRQAAFGYLSYSAIWRLPHGRWS